MVAENERLTPLYGKHVEQGNTCETCIMGEMLLWSSLHLAVNIIKAFYAAMLPEHDATEKYTT